MPDNSCRQGIRKVWPKELWTEAYVTLHYENSLETPGRVGVNKDKVKSKDHGCSQINDYWHYNRAGSVWKGDFNAIYNPEFNAKVAYNIYKRNGSTWGPWYGTCSKNTPKNPHKQIFSNERCGR